MNIVNKLTLRHLKENKGRTVITTLGICVSVAMITAVLVSVASFLNLFGEIELFSGGYEQADFYDLEQSQVVKLKADKRISDVGLYLYPSEDFGFRLNERKSNNYGIGSIYAGDETNLKQKITCEFDGNIPKNENEIAVEQELIDKNELDWKIGDTVSIPVGTRFTLQDGGVNYINGPYCSGEEFDESELKEFKITGILHGNTPTKSNKIIRGLSADEKNGNVCASITLAEVNHKSLDDINDMIKSINVSKDAVSIKSHYLETKFAIDEDSTLAVSLLPMAAVILAIIMTASIMLIYNAFGMSLNERTRYLGMLGSVGATKAQKQQSVYYEGFVLGLVGIPVGTLAGIAGIGITLKAIGSRIMETSMIAGVKDSGITMKAVVPPWVIAGVVFFSALTILISSVIPAKKASAITPIEALKQSKEIKLKARNLKTPKYVRTVFGYEGELAHKNLKRNGRKSRVITASIALSVVLFLSVNYFCQIFMQANNMEIDIPYQINVNLRYDDLDRALNQLSEVAEVDDVFSVTYENFQYGKKAYKNTDQSLAQPEVLTSTYKNLWNKAVIVQLNYVDDKDFNSLCSANGIDYKEYYGSTKKAVVMNNISHNNSGAKVFTDKLIGEKLFFNGASEAEKVEISGFVEYDDKNYLCSLNSKSTVSAYMPISMYGAGIDTSDIYASLGIVTDNHEDVYNRIEETLDSNDYTHVYVSDFVDSFEVVNTIVFILQVFVYGFIALITMITVANIINSISTSIDLRRKEFAMLKSVGATQKGFYKMLCLESLFYGLRALVFSVPLSILISFGLNNLLGSNTIPFEINWLIYLAVFIVVFLIIGFAMFYSVSKLKKDNIIETLKSDDN